MAFKARAIAPVMRGERDACEPLMRAVYARVCAEASAAGFAMMVINEDTRAPFVRVVRGGGSRYVPEERRESKHTGTAFWQKMLRPSDDSTMASTPSPLAVDSFFDPRDI